MNLRNFGVYAGFAFALGACAMLPQISHRPFDPASCSAREFAVYFDGDEAALSPEAREVIDAAGESLHGCRIQHVRITGLADAVGAAETNEEVSIRRAENIADYLADHLHWPRSQFELLATGERGALTDDGLNRPMRRRGRIIVQAVAP